MERSVVIRVLKPGLPAIGIRHPAQQVIEAAVLHHHNDNVLDAGKIRARERCIELLDLFCAKETVLASVAPEILATLRRKSLRFTLMGEAPGGDGMPAGKRHSL